MCSCVQCTSMPDQPGVPQERPGSTGTDDLAIPGGEDDRGSPACIGTPDRPGVPQRPGSTGADDIATESAVTLYAHKVPRVPDSLSQAITVACESGSDRTTFATRCFLFATCGTGCDRRARFGTAVLALRI